MSHTRIHWNQRHEIAHVSPFSFFFPLEPIVLSGSFDRSLYPITVKKIPNMNFGLWCCCCDGQQIIKSETINCIWTFFLKTQTLVLPQGLIIVRLIKLKTSIKPPSANENGFWLLVKLIFYHKWIISILTFNFHRDQLNMAAPKLVLRFEIKWEWLDTSRYQTNLLTGNWGQL